MFALIDCNNFFVSCERAFNPALNNQPVIVLSNNDGCAIARSNEAKALGIRMGAPAFQIKDIIQKNNVRVFSSNYVLYGDMSQRVMQTLATFSPDVEIYSIDEAFLGFQGFERYNFQDYAKEIKRITERNTGIPISIGIAPTKTLAKIANHLGKKVAENKGIFVIHDEETRIKALQKTPIGDVWGIGRKYAQLLTNLGVHTAFDFTQLSASWIRQKMSVIGLRTYEELRGTACIELDEQPAPKKAICTSRSFGKLQSEKAQLEEAVSNFAVNCARKLRSQKSCASLITVFAYTNPHRSDLPQYSGTQTIHLPVASNSSMELTAYAKKALHLFFRQGYLYKKAGVIVSGIVPANRIQTDLFDTKNRADQAVLMTAIDKINDRYGRNTVGLAAQGFQHQWRNLRDLLSPAYTSRWEDIIRVKASP